MVSVVGGGLSGLAAGFYLQRRFGRPLDIYECSNRIGGWIRTERHKDRGFMFEVGPRTIRPKGVTGANTLELIEDLQLPLEAISRGHEAARNRMVYAKGELCPLPNSIFGVLKTLPPFSKPLYRALFKDLATASKLSRLGDESIYDFVERRFGTEIATYAISPLICGICAGDAKEISVRFLMEDLYEKEQKWGSVTRGIFMSKLFSKDDKKTKSGTGIFADDYSPALYKKALHEKWSMYRVQNGLEVLPRSLGQYLRDRNVNIHLSAECKAIVFTPQGVRMHIRGRNVDSEHVIAALPSYKLAACVKEQHPSLSGQLLTIPYVDVAVVNIQYASEDVLNIAAFGFLVPPIECSPILGVIFDSCCFDMPGNTVLTVMMGGRWFEERFGKNPSQKDLLNTALQQVNQILGIKREPKLTRVHILSKCIPQYTVGHKQRIADIRKYITQYKLPMSLCGAAYDGVGINDVILSARMQVEALSSI